MCLTVRYATVIVLSLGGGRGAVTAFMTALNRPLRCEI